jgi:hypothetical protein
VTVSKRFEIERRRDGSPESSRATTYVVRSDRGSRRGSSG